MDYRIRGKWRRIVWIVSLLAVYYFTFLRASPMPDPFYHKVVQRDSAYSGIDPQHRLEAWQEAIQSIAGPLLPSLMGYVLFGIWGTSFGGGHVISDLLT